MKEMEMVYGHLMLRHSNASGLCGHYDCMQAFDFSTCKHCQGNTGFAQESLHYSDTPLHNTFMTL